MSDERPTSAAGRQGSAREPSGAILTVPNLVTFCRLALIPVFLHLALGAKRDLAAFGVAFVLGATDYVDGYLARRLNQVSRLGIAMDPLFDRVAIAAVSTVLIVRHLAPWPAVAAVLARDALILLAVAALGARRVPRPPVSRTGKAGTFATMSSLGVFFAVTIPEPPATWLRPLAWSLYAVGIVLSYSAAVGYARTVAGSLLRDPRARG